MGWFGLTSFFLLFAYVVMERVAYGESKQHDYGDALAKSILFFEGQRSGQLTSTQRMTWRKSSALQDGYDKGVNLVGGYYDAGDNVKYNFPMAFSTTMLAWSVIEFGEFMDVELEHAKEAIRWGTDYLLKSTNTPGIVFVQVGDPYADHNCWERPEDMDTPRTVYAVTPQNPGSEVAAETAAALASSSIAFRSSDPSYSQKLLSRAMEVFDFADKYRGNYSDSLGPWVCPFYCDWSGYEDELLWGAAWLYKASNDQKYWNYLVENISIMGSNPRKRRNNQIKIRGPTSGEFGWDNKDAGINILITNSSPLNNSDPLISKTNSNADEFICGVLPESPTRFVNYSQGGLLFKPGGSNMQNPTAISFLLLAYSTQLKRTNYVVKCGNNIIVNSDRLITLAKTQVDYILGDNPMEMSYMVGYGEKFPFKIHHRGSTLPSIDQHPGHIACKDGTPYFLSESPNPNLLTGAVVGGPYPNDTYPDFRYLFTQSEPTTYINAPLVGVLAFIKAHT